MHRASFSVFNHDVDGTNNVTYSGTTATTTILASISECACAIDGIPKCKVIRRFTEVLFIG